MSGTSSSVTGGTPATGALSVFRSYGENVAKHGIGGDVQFLKEKDTGGDYKIANDSYRLQQILSKEGTRNPYGENVADSFKITKFSNEMSNFNDRDYYKMLNTFEASADSEKYVLRYLSAIGKFRLDWDAAFQQKKGELTAEHYTEAEARRIATNYVHGLMDVDMAILETRFPKSVVDKAKDKIWGQPTVKLTP